MITPAKAEANRCNAQRSTGPRTPEGKEVARWNALRHGLTAETTVLPDEDAECYEALRTRLHAELEPAGALECFLVDRIAAGAWRLRRLSRVEAEVFEHERGWIGFMARNAIRQIREVANADCSETKWCPQRESNPPHQLERLVS
jgi:hypothetical protein